MIYFAIFDLRFICRLTCIRVLTAHIGHDAMIGNANAGLSLTVICVIYIMIAVHEMGNKWHLHEIASVGIAKSEN